MNLHGSTSEAIYFKIANFTNFHCVFCASFYMGLMSPCDIAIPDTDFYATAITVSLTIPVDNYSQFDIAWWKFNSEFDNVL